MIKELLTFNEVIRRRAILEEMVDELNFIKESDLAR